MKELYPLHELDGGTDLASKERAPGGSAGHWRSYSPYLHNTCNTETTRQQDNKLVNDNLSSASELVHPENPSRFISELKSCRM